MNTLNADQARAIQTLEKGNSVAVIAGPGSGKTYTLATAVAETLKTGAKPRNTLCLTFTKKAADNLRERIGQRSNLFVGTFHALAYRLLGDKLEDQHLMTNEEMYAVIAALKISGLTIRELGLQISRAKNGSLTTPQAGKLLEAYDAILQERGWFDYDDLITRCLDELQSRLTRTYSHIFVDEFQDTSPKQYELLQNLMGPDTKLFVIGDPNQSIYRFRGADGSVFNRFEKDFSPEVVNLQTNYRSGGSIVTLANGIFPDALPQNAARTDEGAIHYIETLDEFSEAEYILRAIEQSLGGTSWERTHHDAAELKAARFGDFAVLYRTRRQGEVLAEKLRAAGLPVQRLGEESPYLSLEVQTLLNALKEREASSELLGSTLHSLAEELNLANQPAVVQLENMAMRFRTAEDLFNYLEELAVQEYFDPAADAVVLSTVHASKGLEFKHVFVAGCVEGVLPSKRAKTPAELAEERRLFYVALTRTRDSLTLLSMQKSGGKPAKPSSFLQLLNLPAETDSELAVTQKRRTKARVRRAQQRLF